MVPVIYRTDTFQSKIMNQIEFKGIPTFRILDYDQAVEFYIDFLGFTIDWEHRFAPSEPVYMQISRDELVLHLSENKRFRTGSITFVDTTGIEPFHEELKGKDKPGSVPDVSKTDWHTLQLEIEDPFGNLLRFNESLTE
jgi:catechol 2,3-dioxygenase-like lactoylglutathione lyase family enzyme